MYWEYNIINIFVCVFDTYLIYDFVGYYEGVKTKFAMKKRRIAAILLTAFVVFLVNLCNNAALNLFATLFINFLFIYLVMDGSLFQKCIHYLIIIAFQYGGEFLTAVFLVGRLGEVVTFSPSVKAYAVIVVKMLTFVLYLTIKQLVPRKNESIDKESFFMFILVPIASLGIMFTVTYLAVDFSQGPEKRFVLLTFYMMLVLGNTLVAYSFRRYAAIRRELQEQKRFIDEQEIKMKYYKQVDAVNKKNAEFHHDMCHYLRAIGNLAEDHQNSQILSILDELQVEFFGVEKKNFCSNTILNTVLNEELEEAREKRVSCEVYVEPGFSIGRIREADIISAVGNLYKNALEAASKSRNGFINITMFMENEGRFIIIKMENSYEGTILKDGDKLLTTKKNKLTHGIGIRRIKEVAKRYGGSLRTTYEGGVFQAVLVLSS